jgi:hypothetical protein
MNRSVRSFVFLALIAGIAGGTLGQGSVTLNDPTRGPCAEAVGDQQSLYTAGKPFVATWITTTIQKLKDGTDLAPVVSPLIKIARDSSGKVYTEFQGRTQKGILYRSFSVDDPVSGTTYSWLEWDKAVTVFHYPDMNSREMQEKLRKWPWMKRLWAVPLCATYGPDSTFDGGEFGMRDIGTSRILGTDAQGVLATRNSDPVTEERWYSPDLQIALITRIKDTRFGTFAREFKSLEQIEPDQSLFRIPAGYPVVDSTPPTVSLPVAGIP